jgi:hypothetical protein
MSFAIIVGNVNGFLTREWKGASKESIVWIAAGIGVRVLGVSLLATGNFMQGEQARRSASAVVDGVSVKAMPDAIPSRPVGGADR